jgi:O-antigen ligase
MIVTAATSRRPSVTVWAAVLLGLGVGAGLLVPVVGPRIVAIVIGGMAAIVGVVVAPGVVFGLYLLIPFYKGAAQAYVPVDLTLILAGLNALQVLALVVQRPAGPRLSIGITLWFALAMLVLGGVLYATDQVLALSHAVTYWLLMAVPLAAGAYRVGSDPRYVRQLLWTFFGMGVLTTLVGVPSFSSSERLTVLGANTINVASAALLVPLVGLTFVMRGASARVRLATIVLIPAALIVALATGSRGPILVLFLVAIPAIIRAVAHLRAPDWPRVAAVAGAGLAIVLIVSFASNSLPALSTSRFSSLGDFVAGALGGDQVDSSTTETSATARISFFAAAATMFEERPVLGFGTAGFESVSHRLLGRDEAYPHNAVLQFAAEFGLLGLALFVGLVLLGLIRSLPPGARPVRILFAYFLLQAMLSGDIFSDRTTWGLLLVILLLEVPLLARVEADAPRARPDGPAHGAGVPVA